MAPSPPSPTPKLFPYQREGAEWLKTKKIALLAFCMGLGKSATAIVAASELNARNILVVCRAVAVPNWENEFSIFWPKDKIVNLTVTSYESLHKVLLEDYEYDVFVVDEAHYAKEPRAKRTQRVFGKDGAIHRSKRTWALTGTPTPNHAGEMWPLLYASGHTTLGYEEFVERFCTTRHTAYGRQITGTRIETIPEIRRLIRPLILRRTGEEVNLQLPPITFSELMVPPGKVELGMSKSFLKWVFPVNRVDELKKILEEQLGVIDGIVNGVVTPEALKGLEAAARSISTIRMYLGLQKIQPTIDLITGELEAGEYGKIVIFAVHRDVVEGLRIGLKPFGAVTLYGGTRMDSAELNIHKFQSQKSTKVIICNIASAGTSINLTAADQVLFVEQTFVPADINQALKRCHRIGQSKHIQVRFMSVANTIDQHIAQVLRRKIAEINKIFESEEKRLTPVKEQAKTNSDFW